MYPKAEYFDRWADVHHANLFTRPATSLFQFPKPHFQQTNGDRKPHDTLNLSLLTVNPDQS